MACLKRVGLVLIVLLAMGLATVGAPPETETIHIIDTDDDGFQLEIGTIIDTSLVHILDPGQSITAFLRFQGVSIEFWEPLTNATLRLRTSNNLAYDNSTVTIYGMEHDNLQNETITPGFLSTVPFTDANVILNTSNFDGPNWHQVNVTDIVNEIKNRYRWDSGDDIGFIIIGAEGYDTRYFYDYSVGNGLEAQLVLHWNHAPTPPTGPGIPEFNETYRGYEIWEVDVSDVNRTGSGFDVNWNTLNQTELTEFDAGASITRNNDTWTTTTGMTKQEIGSLYNDTGGANINSYFARFSVNVTDVDNVLAVSDAIPGFFGLSTNVPTGADGLAYGGAGEWVGLICQVNADDARWRIFSRERVGVVDAVYDSSMWYNENELNMLYFEVRVNMTGTAYINYTIFNDADFTSVNWTESEPLVIANGPFRYPQILASLGQAGLSRISHEYYTYLDSPVSLNYSWSIVDENGTTVTTGLDEYEDALIYIDDILGADPEDPTPPGQNWPETGFFTRFGVRGAIFIIGFAMFWGTIWFFSWKRPSGYYLLVGGLVIIMAVGLIIHSLNI